MIENQTLKFNYKIISLSIILILLVSFLDYVTGPNLSFSLFYLIPIVILALNRTSTKSLIILCSIFAALLWFYVDYISKYNTNIFLTTWNSFVRFSFFISVGLLLFNLRIKNTKLLETNLKLTSLNEEKNKFIGIAAHDLRNPLSGIHGLSEMLLNNYNQNSIDESFEYISLIKTTSENMLTLIKNLLDVSKIESGNIDLNYKNQDYIAFVKNHIYICQLLAKHKNIQIHLETSKDIILADFDENYLSEVIYNLLSNVIKYSNKNSEAFVKIQIKNNDEILTEVIDNGKGIAKEEQDKLFNYFQKTTTLPTDGEDSTGLGLAIAKKIIVSMNGKIGVKSNLNEGSNFYYIFPISKNKFT